jgi:Sulfotransferase domain
MSLKKPKIFIVFGMPRTGTTYLYHALGDHPSIFVSYRKESHYFSVNYCKGEEWFCNLYNNAPTGMLCADINPLYYLDANSITRILAYDKDVKVILGVRDPVEFAISLYSNMLAHGLKTPKILDMVQKFDWPVTGHTSLTFELGQAYMQRRIDELRMTFAKNLMLYDFNEFNKNPLTVLKSIELFLDIPPYYHKENLLTAKINASGRRNPLFFNYILKNQKILETLYNILPENFIRHARRFYEKSSVRSSDQQQSKDSAYVDSSISTGEYESLLSFFSADRTYYKKLFSQQPIIILKKSVDHFVRR